MLVHPSDRPCGETEAWGLFFLMFSPLSLAPPFGCHRFSCCDACLLLCVLSTATLTCSTCSLPLALFGLHDSHKGVQGLWREVWEENTGGMQGGVRLYLDEVWELVELSLEDRSWAVKKQVCCPACSPKLRVRLRTNALTTDSTYMRQGAETLMVVAQHASDGSLDRRAPEMLQQLQGVLKGRTWVRPGSGPFSAAGRAAT